MNTWRSAALSARGAKPRLAQAPPAPPSDDVLRQLCSIAADYADARKRGKDEAATTWKGLFAMTAESRTGTMDRRSLLDDMAAYPDCKVPEQYLRELAPGSAPLSGALRPVRVDREVLASLLGAVAQRMTMAQWNWDMDFWQGLERGFGKGTYLPGDEVRTYISNKARRAELQRAIEDLKAEQAAKKKPPPAPAPAPRARPPFKWPPSKPYYPPSFNQQGMDIPSGGAAAPSGSVPPPPPVPSVHFPTAPIASPVAVPTTPEWMRRRPDAPPPGGFAAMRTGGLPFPFGVFGPTAPAATGVAAGGGGTSAIMIT